MHTSGFAERAHPGGGGPQVMTSPAASAGPVSVPPSNGGPLPPSTRTQDPPPQSAVQPQPTPGSQLHTLAVQPCEGSHTNPGPHTSGISLRAQPGGGSPHSLVSLAASTVPDASAPALWPLPPVTPPLVAPAVPEPLALVEDLPPQLTTMMASASSSAALIVSDIGDPKDRIVRRGRWGPSLRGFRPRSSPNRRPLQCRWTDRNRLPPAHR